MTLCSGVVDIRKSISYPVSPQKEMRPDGGQILDFTGTNPAAGSEIDDSVPTGRVWRILAISFSLTTDANAANRRVHVILLGPSGVEIDTFSDVDQIASTTRKYSVAAFGAIPDTLDDNDILIPLPADIFLPAGSAVQTLTTNRQAGDDFGTPSILVEQFFSPA